jgi:TolA-binding protein
MSAESQPITPAAFTQALKALPLSSVYGKVVELHNSINNLVRSNVDLKEYILSSAVTASTTSTTDASATAARDMAAETTELESYIAQNEEVIASMRQRIGLCKAEVEERGQIWYDQLDELSGGATVDARGLAEQHDEERLDHGASQTGGTSSSRSNANGETGVNGVSNGRREGAGTTPEDIDMEGNEEDGVYL